MHFVAFKYTSVNLLLYYLHRRHERTITLLYVESNNHTLVRCQLLGRFVVNWTYDMTWWVSRAHNQNVFGGARGARFFFMWCPLMHGERDLDLNHICSLSPAPMTTQFVTHLIWLHLYQGFTNYSKVVWNVSFICFEWWMDVKPWMFALGAGLFV